MTDDEDNGFDGYFVIEIIVGSMVGSALWDLVKLAWRWGQQ